MNYNLEYNQSRHRYSSASTGNAYLKILMPYLDNPSEEAITASSQIRKQHETIKLLNEEVRTLQQKCL